MSTAAVQAPPTTAVAAGTGGRWPGRARRALEVVAGAALFLGASGAALGAALDTETGRRTVASRVTSGLDGLWEGKLRIERIGRLKLWRGEVSGAEVRVLGADGQQVLRATGVEGRVRVGELLRTLVGKGPMSVWVEGARVADADVVLREDEHGELTLARAFRSTTPSTPESEAAPRGVVVHIPGFEVKHGWAHGGLGGVPELDADLDEARGDLAVEMDGVRVRLGGGQARARRLIPLEGNPEVSTRIEHGLLVIPDVGELRAEVTLPDVRVGTLGGRVVASIDGSDVAATVDIPRTEAAAVRALLPQAPIYDPVSVRAEAHGRLPTLEVGADVTVGEGKAHATGKLALADVVRIDADVQADGVSLRSFAPEAPSGWVSAHVTGTTWVGGPEPVATFVADVAPTTLDGQAVPAVRAVGKVQGEAVEGTVWAQEPGLWARADVQLGAAQPAGRPLRLGVEAHSDEIGQNARVGGQVHGRVHVVGQGKLWVGGPESVRIEQARAQLDASGVRAGTARVGALRADVKASGTPSALALELEAKARRVEAGGTSWSQASVRAVGGLSGARVAVQAEGTDGERVAARAQVGWGGGATTVRDGQATVDHRGEHVEARVARVQVGGGRVRVERAVVDGEVGHAELDLNASRKAVKVDGQIERVQIERLARLLGVDVAQAGGQLGGSVHAEMTGREAHGRLGLRWTEGRVGEIQDLRAELDAELAGRTLTGSAEAHWGTGAQARVEVRRVELDGPALDVASWRRAGLDVQGHGDAELSVLLALLPKEQRPLPAAAGQLAVDLRAERARGEGLPNVRLDARSKGLDLLLPPPEAEEPLRASSLSTPAPAPNSVRVGPRTTGARRLTGVELDVRAAFDGTERAARVQASARDRQGDLVTALVSAPVPAAWLEKGPSFDRASLEQLPFTARVALPRRSVSQWPELVRPQGISGELGADVSWQGSLRDPSITVEVDGHQLEMPATPTARAPIDVQVRAAAAHDHYRAGADITQSGRRVASARAEGALPLAPLLAGSPAASWDSDVDLALTGLPLQSFGALLGTPVTGCVYGQVRVGGLHRDAHLSASVRVEELSIGEVRGTTLRLDANLDAAGFALRAEADEPDGQLRLLARGASRWGASLAPTPLVDGSMQLEVRAQNFQIKPLEPLLRPSVARLEGRLDGSLRLVPNPTEFTRSRFEGSLHLQHGIVDPVDLGQELHDIDLLVVAEPDGLVRLTQGSVRGLSGRVQLSGQMRMDGLRLVEATGDLRIAERERFLVTSQGVALGEAWGHISLNARPAPPKQGTVLLEARVQKLEFELPSSVAHSLQPLEPEPSIRLGHRTSDQTFLVFATDAEHPSEERRPIGRRAEQIGAEIVDTARRGQTPATLDPKSVAPSDAQVVEPTPDTRFEARVSVPTLPNTRRPDTRFGPTAPGEPTDPDQDAEARRRARDERRQRLRRQRTPTMPVSPLLLDVHLDEHPVRIRQGSRIDIWIKGRLQVGVGGTNAAVDGQVQVERGHADVQGRRFVIDHALATFSPADEPSNPTLRAQAHFEASDATLVYAEFLGTVESGHLTLRSDPALSQGEILSLLLFGSRDGLASQRNGAGNDAARAASLGGGYLSEGLNSALSDLSLGQVTTRVDTSSSANPRPEVAVAITQDVSVALSYRLGLPTPGQNPDTSTVRLEYRFRPRWSLETSFGDRGTTIVDLAWSYRY